MHLEHGDFSTLLTPSELTDTLLLGIISCTFVCNVLAQPRQHNCTFCTLVAHHRCEFNPPSCLSPTIIRCCCLFSTITGCYALNTARAASNILPERVPLAFRQCSSSAGKWPSTVCTPDLNHPWYHPSSKRCIGESKEDTEPGPDEGG